MSDKVHPLVRKKLASVYPEEQVAIVAAEVLAGLDTDTVMTPDERLRFGRYMIANFTGLKSAVGAAIAMQAILHGAKR